MGGRANKPQTRQTHGKKNMQNTHRTIQFICKINAEEQQEFLELFAEAQKILKFKLNLESSKSDLIRQCLKLGLVEFIKKVNSWKEST